MKNLLCLLFILLAVSNSKLTYLAQLVRHGAKYPTNDFYDYNQTKQFKGALTGVGMRQQYLLGSFLHQDYLVNLQLTNSRFNPKEVQVFSTSYDRSIQSAYCQLYGLFPTGQGHVIPTNIDQALLNPPFDVSSNLQYQLNDGQFALNKGFQPIPVRIADQILNYCPNYGLLVTQRLKQISNQTVVFQAQHSVLIAKMVVVFNISSLQATVPAMSDLYDTIISDIYLGRQMPKGFTDSDLKELKFINDYYQTLLKSSWYAQLLSTPFTNLLIQNLQKATLKTTKKKLSIYSAHAQNILQLQSVLNMTSPDCLTQQWKNQTVTFLNCVQTPGFAANLLIELHQDEQSFTNQVKVKYNGQYVNLCQKKSTLCEVNQFIARLQKTIHADFQKQCGIQSGQNNSQIDAKDFRIFQ